MAAALMSLDYEHLYQRELTQRLSELSDRIRELEDKIDTQNERLARLETTLSIKAGIWGLGAGLAAGGMWVTIWILSRMFHA